jgi:hypothetical protein
MKAKVGSENQLGERVSNSEGRKGGKTVGEEMRRRRRKRRRK